MQPAGDLEDVANRFYAAYGITDAGATLIRPDGFIAWCRSGADGTEPALDEILQRLRMRPAVSVADGLR